MADERLQQLRRAWDAGDLDTQVRLLRERMRTGELSEDRVRLAAYLGVEPARGLEPDRPRDERFNQWAHWIGRYGRLPLARAGVAAAWAAKVEYSPANLRSLHAFETWILCPCDACHMSAESTLAPYDRFEPSGNRFVRTLCGVLQSGPYKLRGSTAIGELVEIERRGKVGAAAKGFVGSVQSRLRKAIESELVPWALGLRDPVDERVAAREAGT